MMPQIAFLILSVTHSAGPFAMDMASGNVASQCNLYILDGDTGEELELSSLGSKGLALDWDTVDASPWRFGTAAIANRRETYARLEVGCRVSTHLDATEFFDGERVYDATQDTSSERFTGRFPLAAVSDDAVCMALGLHPAQWLSYLRHACTSEDGSLTLSTATRIVIDPGKKGEVRFLAGCFATPWRHYEALHWYFEEFPSFFCPSNDVDPRVNLNGGSYLAWTSSPSPEMCRRLCVGWDWCYAPFKRTGDIYGRPEFWAYAPARPHGKDRLVSIEEYHALRRAKFDHGKACGVAMACYIPAQIWCEEQLAREHYNDALIADPHAKTYFDTPWVTGPDNECRMFPYKTSFGEQSLVDMAGLVRENNIQAFGFDTANGGARYYGPHVNECPGRAWDDKGVYVDEGVAIAKLMDWCHEQTLASGRTLAVISNPGASPCYLTPIRSDSAMIEYDPTSMHSQAVQTLRNFLGHKTMVFWENYDLEGFLDYENLTSAQMTDALNGLADYTIIASLRLAAIPTPRICLGNRKLAEWLPLLTEIAQTGWQPVAAATSDPALTISRAGHGMRQFLMTGNVHPHSVEGVISAHNRWLSDGAMLFMAEGTDGATQRIAGGNTHVDFILPSRAALVLRAMAVLAPSPNELEVAVVRHSDIDRVLLEFNLSCPGNHSVEIKLPDWPGWLPERVALDGHDIGMKRETAGWTSVAPITLRARQTLTVAWRSPVFDVSLADLVGFPWTQGERVGFEVHVPAGAAPEVTYAAQRLADYFPYYCAHARTPAVGMAPPSVTTGAAVGKKAAVTLNVDASLSRPQAIALREGGRVLAVAGQTPVDVKEAVFKLLAVLDRKYTYAGGLVGTPAIEATGLTGKEIQYE